MSEVELKPCPLCGRKKLTVKTNRHVSHVTCESCNLTLTRETEKEAIQYWNKRVGKEKVIEELKHCRDSYDINEQPENRFDFRECADVREHKGKWIAYNEAIKVVERGEIE